MFNKKESEPRIKWTASDEKFERKEGNDWVKYTVGSYFEKIYDINLRFPNMPIVCTGGGWYPVEFLYHEVARVPNSNDTEKVNRVLAYQDRFAAGDRMDHISQLKGHANGSSNTNVHNVEELFGSFNLELLNEAITLEARRLDPPCISFKNEVLRDTHSGSWNLNRKVFERYAYAK